MARPSKDSHAVSIRLESELFDCLNDFCERSGQSKTGAIKER